MVFSVIVRDIYIPVGLCSAVFSSHFFSFRQEVAQPSNTGVGKLPVFIFVFLFDII